MKAVELYRELKRSGTGEKKLDEIRKWLKQEDRRGKNRADRPAEELLQHLVELMGHPGKPADKDAGIRHMPSTPGYPLFCPGTVAKAADIIAKGKWDPTPSPRVDEFDPPPEEAPSEGD